MTAVDLPAPRIGPVSSLAPKPVRLVLNWGRRYSLWVFNFGLACCAIEFIATSMSRYDFIRLGVIPFAPSPRQADLMVVSGNSHRQDGAGDQASLRADARAEVRDLIRRLLQLRWPVLGQLLGDQGRRPDHSCRRVRALAVHRGLKRCCRESSSCKRRSPVRSVRQRYRPSARALTRPLVEPA